MIKFNIDGQELTVENGSTIIEAADNAGISIPRFCYHKKLSVAANCRMCLVEVVNAPKPMPACATPVSEGMQVQTKSPKALMAQRAVMEFLLINHPLDCPICDQGGQCELQDVSMGYGEGVSKYNQGKRSVKDEYVGPLIATGMTRCIHCTRCVRFGEEVAGVKELGGIGRGEETEIRTFINKSINSELSGNLVDVCPVGALTSKPFRFTARAWELQQYPSIAAHDAVGSNIYVHSVNNKVKQIVPRENEQVNEVWLSDRDRFSYEALNHEERLLTPLVKVDGELQAADWETALELAVSAIKEQASNDANNLIALVSPNSTVEEGYLLQKILRGLGSNNIDHRLKLEHDFTTGCQDISIAELENSDCFLLVGCAPRKSIPMLNHRIRKAALKGAKVNTINPSAYDWNYDLAFDHVISPVNMVNEVSAVLKHLYTLKNMSLPKALRKVHVSEQAEVIAENLNVASKPVIILGELALAHPDRDYLYKLFSYIKHILDCGSVVLSEGCNSKGLSLAGVLPTKQAGGYNVSHPGSNIHNAFNRPIDEGTYILFNIDPEFDCYNGLASLTKLENSKKVICFSPFISETMHKYADIVFPLAPFVETSGTFVNLDNKWQNFNASVAASKHSKVRPGWKILCALARLLDLAEDEFSFESSADVKQEVFGLNTGALANKQDKIIDLEQADTTNNSSKLEEDYQSKLINHNETELTMVTLVAETNCYKTDNLVRRANSLQQTNDAKSVNNITISGSLADKLAVVSGDSLAISTIQDIDNLEKIVRRNVICDDRLPDDIAYMSMGSLDTLSLFKPYQQIVLINKTNK